MTSTAPMPPPCGFLGAIVGWRGALSLVVPLGLACVAAAFAARLQWNRTTGDF